MTDERRRELDQRWAEIHRQLDDLHAGKVQPGDADPLAREDELQGELDAIEHETGLDYLERSRRERRPPV